MVFFVQAAAAPAEAREVDDEAKEKEREAAIVKIQSLGRKQQAKNEVAEKRKASTLH